MRDDRSPHGRDHPRHHQVFPVDGHALQLFGCKGAAAQAVAQIIFIIVKARGGIAEIVQEGVRHAPGRFDVPVQVAGGKHGPLVPPGLQDLRNAVNLRAAGEQRLHRLVHIITPVGIAVAVQHLVGHVRGGRVDKKDPPVLPQRFAVAVDDPGHIGHGLGRVCLDDLLSSVPAHEPEGGALRLRGGKRGALRLGRRVFCRGGKRGGRRLGRLVADHAKLGVKGLPGLGLLVRLSENACQGVGQGNHLLPRREGIGEILLKLLHKLPRGERGSAQLRKGLKIAVLLLGKAAGLVGEQQQEKPQRQRGEQQDIVFGKQQDLLHTETPFKSGNR